MGLSQYTIIEGRLECLPCRRERSKESINAFTHTARPEAPTMWPVVMMLLLAAPLGGPPADHEECNFLGDTMYWVECCVIGLTCGGVIPLPWVREAP